jgi:acetoin utilization deacetylase AcuC-like enzyme
VLDAVERSDLDVVRAAPDPVPDDILFAIHAEPYVEMVRACARSGGGILDPDTVVSAASYDAALRAAGAAVAAVDHVVRGEAGTAAFAAVRPPGHHALPAKGMGFCLFNNAACAAVAARTRHGLERVMILDWDVHHGNGTEEIFYRDGSVLYVSLHQENWYPGTGQWDNFGGGAGEGFTVNAPLPAGTGDEGYRLVLEELVIPLGAAFRPDVLVISAGYDAQRGDPLGGMLVSTGGFGVLTELAVQAAGPPRRVVAVLEGGYHLQPLAHSVMATLAVLSGMPPPADTGSAPDEVPYRVISERVRRTRSALRNYWNI